MQATEHGTVVSPRGANTDITSMFRGFGLRASGQRGRVTGRWKHTTVRPYPGQRGPVRLSDQLIRVGPDLADAVGVEEREVTLASERVPITHRITTIYHREGGEWQMAHRHTAASPAMIGLLSRRQPPPS